MKKYIFIASLFALSSLACSNVIDVGDKDYVPPGEQDKDKDKDNGKEPGKDNDKDKEDIEPDGECNLNGEIRCNGEKGRLVCIENNWTELNPCPEGCLDGECIDPSYFMSCETPASLQIGHTVTGDTHTESQNLNWGNTCASYVANAGSEMIYALNIAEVGLYTFDLDASASDDGFSFYIQRECAKAETVYPDSCMHSYSKAKNKTNVQLNPGKHYVIVDNPAPKGITSYKLTTSQSSEPLTVCNQGYKSVAGKYIDINVPQGIDGNTKDGKSQVNWDVKYQCMQPGTGGNELVYSFRLEEPKTVQALLAMSPLESTDTKQEQLGGAIYILSCTRESSLMSACINTVSGENLKLETSLEPGLYNLVIDNVYSTGSKDFAFSLQVSAY